MRTVKTILLGRLPVVWLLAFVGLPILSDGARTPKRPNPKDLHCNWFMEGVDFGRRSAHGVWKTTPDSRPKKKANLPEIQAKARNKAAMQVPRAAQPDMVSWMKDIISELMTLHPNWNQMEVFPIVWQSVFINLFRERDLQWAKEKPVPVRLSEQALRKALATQWRRITGASLRKNELLRLCKSVHVLAKRTPLLRESQVEFEHRMNRPAVKMTEGDYFRMLWDLQSVASLDIHENIRKSLTDADLLSVWYVYHHASEFVDISGRMARKALQTVSLRLPEKHILASDEHTAWWHHIAAYQRTNKYRLNERINALLDLFLPYDTQKPAAPLSLQAALTNPAARAVLRHATLRLLSASIGRLGDQFYKEEGSLETTQGYALNSEAREAWLGFNSSADADAPLWRNEVEQQLKSTLAEVVRHGVQLAINERHDNNDGDHREKLEPLLREFLFINETATAQAEMVLEYAPDILSHFHIWRDMTPFRRRTPAGVAFFPPGLASQNHTEGKPRLEIYDFVPFPKSNHLFESLAHLAQVAGFAKRMYPEANISLVIYTAAPVNRLEAPFALDSQSFLTLPPSPSLLSLYGFPISLRQVEIENTANN